MKTNYLLVLFLMCNAQQALADSNKISTKQKQIQIYTSCMNSMQGKIFGQRFCLAKAGLTEPMISV